VSDHHVSHDDHAMEAARSAQAAALATHDAVRRIEGLTEAQLTPARIEPIVLTQAAPIVADKMGEVYSPSIGLFNPSNVSPVYLGLGGSTPAPGQRAPSCPPQALLVLPVKVGDIEIGADPALLGVNTLVCWLLRFYSVQPAFLGSV
jgi:hypothetical protein